MRWQSRVCVPLKAMCSTKWLMPLTRALSCWLPARTNTLTLALPRCGSRMATTRAPLGSVARVVSVSGDAGFTPPMLGGGLAFRPPRLLITMKSLCLRLLLPVVLSWLTRCASLPPPAGSFGTRLFFSLHEFGRINHRMHNKLFIADGTFAVSGGRNIGHEYFMHSAAANFIDLDVLSAGPVVRELSRAFDTYWNSERVYPIDSVATVRLPAAEARQRFDELIGRAGPGIAERPRDVLGATPVAQQLDGGALTLTLATARVLADSPDKVAGVTAATSAQTVTDQTLRVFTAAKEEVNIASPYFIPGERGMAIIRAVGATEENGRITLVTNSLGSTDEPMVYRGYARYRLAMLKAGVRIYEVSPSLSRRTGKLGNFGRSLGRLHAKAATMDRKTIFIGSLNLD